MWPKTIDLGKMNLGVWLQLKQNQKESLYFNWIHHIVWGVFVLILFKCKTIWKRKEKKINECKTLVNLIILPLSLNYIAFCAPPLKKISFLNVTKHFYSCDHLILFHSIRFFSHNCQAQLRRNWIFSFGWDYL